jgi:hypothetical protein
MKPKVALSQISKYILSIFIVTLLLVVASNHPTIDDQLPVLDRAGTVRS